MSKSKDPAPVHIGGGLSCPKCRAPMKRYKHSEAWRPLSGRGLYIYWDRCLPCGHIQNYGRCYIPANKVAEYFSANTTKARQAAPMTKIEPPFSDRETATLLAALRAWQASTGTATREHDHIATDGGTLDPLSDAEIDALCIAINTGCEADRSF